MRQLWPTESDSSKLYPKKSKEQYNEIIEKISELVDDLNAYIQDFDNYKDELSNKITTIILNTTKAEIDEATIKSLVVDALSSNSLISESIQADRLTINTDALIERLNSTFARITDLIADNIESNKIESKEIEAEKIKAKSAEIDEYDITNLNSTNADISNASIQNAEIESANVLNLSADIADVDDLKSNTLEAEEANIKNADITKLEYEFAINDDDAFQDITTAADSDGIVYIILPKFTNGIYYLSGIDTSNNDTLFTIEILNSINNRFLRWSDSSIKYLLEAYDLENFVIKLDTHNKAIRLYHRADTKDTITPPTIVSTYIEPSQNDTAYYKIVYQNGNKVFKPLDLFNEGSAVGVLTLDQTNDYEEVALQDPTKYDTAEDVIRVDYIPNQDVNKEADVDFNSAHINNITHLEEDGTIKNPYFFAGKRSNYDASYLKDYALVILEEDNNPPLEPPKVNP